MNQLRQSQPTPPEPARFSVRLVTAGGHAFTLCGQRDPASAGADLLRDALQVSRATLAVMPAIQHSTQKEAVGSNGANH